ncbi:MAG: glycosyltransferase family 9 protein [Elusimicrobia bacterium]|nr:glycosyltransferase family 9 protein [Elusimicrobiota bacterium]
MFRPDPKILLVSLDNIGDLVFASALAAPLKRRFPDSELCVWCKAYAADAARLIPGAARVFAADPFWDRSPGKPKGPLGDFMGALLDIRRERFSLALLCSASMKSAAAVFAAGIPERVGFERRLGRLWLSQAVRAPDAGRPALEELSRLLGALGIAPEPLRCRLDAGPLAGRRAELSRAVGSRPLAALHPFAGDRARCVPLREWRGFAEGLGSNGYSPLWIGSSAELKSFRAESGELEGHWWIDRLGSGALADTAAGISLAAAFAGHDSGPLHLAAAFGVPCLGIFTPGEPRRTFPQGVGPSRVLARPGPESLNAAEMSAEFAQLLRGAGKR